MARPDRQTVKTPAPRCALLAAVAQACIGTWQFWMNSHSYELLPDHWYAHPSLCATASFAVLWLVGARLPKALALPGIAVATAAGCACACLVAGGFGPGVQRLVPLALLLAGICLAVLQLANALLLAHLSEQEAFLAVCASSIASSLAVIALPYVPEAADGAVGAAAPALAAACVVRAGRQTRRPASTLYLKGPLGHTLARPLFCLCVLRFAYSVANVLLKAEHGSFVYGPSPNRAIGVLAGIIVIAWLAFLVWWVQVKKRAVDFLLLVKAPFVLMVLTFVCNGIWGSSPLLQIATYSTSCLTGVCFLMLAVDVAQHSDSNPVRATSIVFLCDFAAYYLGRCPLYGLLLASGPTGTPFHENLSLALLGTMAIAIVAAVSPQSKAFRAIFHDLNNASVSFDTSDELARCCGSVARRCGLSKREEEVMRFIVQGYTKPYIAETLAISDSTVRTHTRRLYEKVGVHSRRELQEMVDLERR